MYKFETSGNGSTQERNNKLKQRRRENEAKSVGSSKIDTSLRSLKSDSTVQFLYVNKVCLLYVEVTSNYIYEHFYIAWDHEILLFVNKYI